MSFFFSWYVVDAEQGMMGDSAGGGLALALAEHFKAEGIHVPDELILFSPLVDTVGENEEIREYQQKDP